MLKFALAGNPNCGKTTLFNSLTGSTAHVGNWPGVTVDKREGEYKKAKEPISIVDLPGIYSLSPYTPEEVVAGNYIIEEKPDCIINIIDATNLERNLYLTTQLLEIDIPIVIALNMIDVVEKNGDKIDVEALEKSIGVPVIKISALKCTGLKELMNRAYKVCKTTRKGTTVLKNAPIMQIINDVSIALDGRGVNNHLFHSIKLVEGNESEIKNYPYVKVMIDNFIKTYDDKIFGDDLEAVIADSRYKYITKNYSPAMTKKMAEYGEIKTASSKIDNVLTHKIWSIPIFIVIMFLIFHLTFSEDILFLGSMGVFDGITLQETEIIGDTSVQKFVSSISLHTFFGCYNGVGLYSPGVVLFNSIEALTGLLNAFMQDALSNAPLWVSGLICDAILGGIFSILSFLPQILVLFLFFSILEDSGYMARIAFILDRPLRKFGLSGRAFLPMIMGFGCSVPAIINTRTLADKNERTATIRVIPFFSCGAKLPILTAISGAIVLSFKISNADLITYGMYLLGVLTAFISVLIMKNTTMKGEAPPFIMELPDYRLPQFSSLMKLLWEKAEHFIKKAFTVILASTIIVWLISHFSWEWRFLDDYHVSDSILAGIGKILQPIFTPLGFGSQLGEFGWIFVVSAICGIIAKENVVATFATMATCIVGGFTATETMSGIDAVSLIVSVTGATVPALIAFIAFNMTTIPCSATVATAKAELNDNKLFRYTLLFWFAISYILASSIYLIGTRWWTAIIIVAIIVAFIIVVVLYNKGKLYKLSLFVNKLKNIRSNNLCKHCNGHCENCKIRK